ncbi:MAG TPA: polysaccharide deacetylase family protein [Polyangiaceae bacterium]
MLHSTGALRAILALRASAPLPWLSILTYHRFADPSGEEPFDDGVADATEEEFDRQLAYLKRYFHMVGFDELRAWTLGKKLPPNPLAITFDDGYLDCYTRALPILKRHDVAAIFFVATSFITERRTYWWDRIAYVIKQSRRDSLLLEYPFPFEIRLRGDRAEAVDVVFRLIKDRHPIDIGRLLDELSAAADVPWTPELDHRVADRLIMTWDHVRALRRAGMAVQSHTRTHRVLHRLGLNELRDELAGSRADLERELGEPVRAVAYPVGKPLVGDSPVRAALESAGYELGFSNGTGSTPLWGQRDRFDIRRQPIGRNLPPSYVLGMLAVPPLAPRARWRSIPG